MSQAKCITLNELLAEIRVKAEVESKKTKKLATRWVAHLFYLVVHELFSLEPKDKKFAAALMELFYWADELRYNTEVIDNEKSLTEALNKAMAPFESDLWQFREAWRYIEFKEEFSKDLWYYEVVNYLKTKGLFGAPHFMRVSRDSPELWVYTESPDHGRADRQVKTKLGKLLTKLLPTEKAADIQRVATYFQNAGAMGVQFARTEEECVRAYADGPQSCMKGKEAVRAYASPDLAIAYVTDINGRITARTVCNTVKKTFTRIYGNADGIRPALEKEGWTRGSLEGCRLKTIWHNNDEASNHLTIPWVDHPDAGLQVPISGLGNGVERAQGGMITGQTKGKWDADTETLTICHSGPHVLGDGALAVKRSEKGKAYAKAHPVMQPVAGAAAMKRTMTIGEAIEAELA